MATIERAISIRQPYVEQILLGKKKYEYRSTLTHIRERIYLYASKKPVPDDAEWRRAKSEFGKLPTGVIVGSIVVADCEWSEKDNCFRYRLESPVRFRKHLTPNGQPQPKFFKPKV
jgi:ASCH domain